MKPQHPFITKPDDQEVAEADLQSAGVVVMPEKTPGKKPGQRQGAQDEAKGQGTEVPPLEPPATPTGIISGNSV